MLYRFLVHIHSALRWVVLSAMIIVIIRSALLLMTHGNEGRSGSRIPGLALSLLHTQVFIGLILYFISPKVVFAVSAFSNRFLRFFLTEHISLMIIAAVLATIGVIKAKRVTTQKKHTRLLLFFLMAFIIILTSIPWPWERLSAGWI